MLPTRPAIRSEPDRPMIVTWRITTHTTRPRGAPSAIRIPISPVRRATVYDMVPYNPTHAIISASMFVPCSLRL